MSAPVRATEIIVCLEDGTEVTLYPDGTARVDLAGMRVARHDLYGYVVVGAGGTVTGHMAGDQVRTAPLSPHAERAALNAAVRQVPRARRAARAALREHAAAAARARDVAREARDA